MSSGGRYSSGEYVTSDDRSNAARSRIFWCQIHVSEIVHIRATAAACNSADCTNRPHGSFCWTKTSRHRSNSPPPGNPSGRRAAQTPLRNSGLAGSRSTKSFNSLLPADSISSSNSYDDAPEGGIRGASLARHGRLLCSKIIADLERLLAGNLGRQICSSPRGRFIDTWINKKRSLGLHRHRRHADDARGVIVRHRSSDFVRPFFLPITSEVITS